MYNSNKTVPPVAGEIKDISKVNLDQTVPGKTKFIVFQENQIQRRVRIFSCVMLHMMKMHERVI